MHTRSSQQGEEPLLVTYRSYIWTYWISKMYKELAKNHDSWGLVVAGTLYSIYSKLEIQWMYVDICKQLVTLKEQYTIILTFEEPFQICHVNNL